jgi:hypothetical protein
VKRLCLVLSAALLSMLLAPMALSAEAAKAKPSLSFAFATNQVDQNAAVTISVAAKGLPKKTKIYVQRQFGTKRSFKNVAAAPASGTVSLPGVATGKYAYRLVAVKKVKKHRTKIVATSGVKTLYSYGNISVAQLCARSSNTRVSYCQANTKPVGGQVFSYSAYSIAEEGPEGDAAVQAQKSSCRSAHLEFAVSNDWADDGVTTAGVALYQETADMATAATGARQVGVADFAIGSPSWNLVFWTEPDGDGTVYWRGTFNCFTTSGDA